MKLFLVLFAGFFLISCSGPGSETSTVAIRFPIEEFAVANQRTVWIVTDRDELVRIVDLEADVVEFPGKPQTVFFLNENEGWVFASDSNLWATIDGGQNWVQRSSLTDLGPTITELVFTDSANGWLVVWFGVLTTSDGGTTWNMVYPNDERNYESLSAQPTNMSVVTKDTAWVAMT